MKAFDVIGTSMWPVLKDGDTVLVDETRVPKEGDLVARVIEDVAIVHRYLSPGLTKGDRFSEADPTWIAQPQELLRREAMTVVGVLPKGFNRAKMRGSADLKAQLALGKLDFLQTKLSQLQLKTQSKFLKRTLLAALIANGSLIRRNLFRALRGKKNVE